jgi:cell division protein FtsI (penicillin-binding protein 3)
MTDNANDIFWRVYIVYILCVAFGLLILFRVGYIQFVEGDAWREKARNSTMRYVNIDAIRGDILADDGRLLATSIPVYEIRMDLHHSVISDQVFREGIDSLAYHLSRLFRDKSREEYKRMIVNSRREQERYFLVKRNVSYHQLIEMKRFPIFRLGRFKGGLMVVERTRREAPFKSLASRTIGYEREGVYVGLEGAYREYLEGVQGKRLMQRISGGNWMPVNDENEIRSQNGKDIVTTLNVNFQDIAENSLMKQLQRYNAHHGTVVVMEVATGKIKAISNLTRSASGHYSETFNYAIGESAEPGSTFKLAVMMALLEDNKVNPEDFIATGNGRIIYADRLMSDAKEGGFGTITVKQSFALSSNVALSLMMRNAYKSNPQDFFNRLSDFLVDKPLGIEIKGEGNPYFPKPGQSDWSGISLEWMSIGYNISLTPLQSLGLYNAVANNGRYMKPMFVEEVRQTGRTIKRFEPQVLKSKVCSNSTLETIRDMLEEVIESGTGQAIKTPTYKIAGKTGTAQVAKAGAGYKSGERKIYRASFAGYFPADKPLYSMIVMVHDPKGYVYSGSQVAAPVFREIADKIMATQIQGRDNYIQGSALAALPDVMGGKPEDLKKIYSAFDHRLRFRQKDMKWAMVRVVEDDKVEVTAREMIENLVPDVVGLGLRDALYLLENAGMQVRFSGRGMVRSQSIRPGTRVVGGNEIIIRLS